MCSGCDQLSIALTAERERSARLEAALRELVECKDLRNRMIKFRNEGARGGNPGMTDAEYIAADVDYARRKPLAWEVARALTPTAKEQT